MLFKSMFLGQTLETPASHYSPERTKLCPPPSPVGLVEFSWHSFIIICFPIWFLNFMYPQHCKAATKSMCSYYILMAFILFSSIFVSEEVLDRLFKCSNFYISPLTTVYTFWLCGLIIFFQLW